jgi:hypothetical protein
MLHRLTEKTAILNEMAVVAEIASVEKQQVNGGSFFLT